MRLGNTAPVVTQEYFEGSVYRNILTILRDIEDSRKKSLAAMDFIISAPGAPFDFHGVCGFFRIGCWHHMEMGWTGPGAAANGYAHNKLNMDYWALLVAKRKGINVNPRDRADLTTKLYPGNANQIWSTPAQTDKALKDVRFYYQDFRPLIRSLELELNRVRLPMLDRLSSVVESMARYLSNMHGEFIYSPNQPDKYDSDRIAALEAEAYLKEMQTWIVEMVQKVKERAESDAAVLQKMAEAATRKGDTAIAVQSVADTKKAQSVSTQAASDVKNITSTGPGIGVLVPVGILASLLLL